ncbi:putative oxygenase MesX, partial [Enterobacter asburiae]
MSNKQQYNKYGNYFEAICGIRDYDFSVRLLEHNKNQQHFSIPEKFG